MGDNADKRNPDGSNILVALSKSNTSFSKKETAHSVQAKAQIRRQMQNTHKIQQVLLDKQLETLSGIEMEKLSRGSPLMMFPSIGMNKNKTDQEDPAEKTQMLPESVVQCGHCKKHFKDYNYLKKHYIKMHPDKKYA